jgi:hypothetical protein
MRQNLSETLDQSLALLETGQATLAECLDRYPEYADDLLPLLETALEVRRLPKPTASPAALAAGRHRMLEALAEKEHRQAAFPNLLHRYASWLAVLFGREEGLPVQRRRFAAPLAVVAMLVLIVFAVAGLSLLPWPGKTVAQTATLTQVSGVVEVMAAGSDTWQPVSVGVQVETGDRIRTRSLSNATLAFFDGSTVGMGAVTEMAFVEMSSRRDGSNRVIALYQQLGQAHSRVQSLPDLASRFEIETPAADVVVRGTEFDTAVEPDGATSVAVVEGIVEVVAQGNTVAVEAGQEVAIEPGEPPPAPVQPTSTPTPTSPRPTEETPRLAPSETPQPPGQTKTPQPPGQTKTPQPPGQTKTPQPPGQTKTPQPPGQTKTPQPPGQTKTPQPPGQTKTPQPPGQTKTPQPPGQDEKPKPPGGEKEKKDKKDKKDKKK